MPFNDRAAIFLKVCVFGVFFLEETAWLMIIPLFLCA